MGLVLSLFPGVGMLDMAFEGEGFCVVRGPDTLWGGDIHAFTPPPGVFAGVIGGPPCLAHAKFADLNRAAGNEVAADLVPEFLRCVAQARPSRWLMENAPGVPDANVDGYRVHRQTVDNRWLGEVQRRRRAFQFGTVDGRPLRVQFAALDHPEEDTTCLASEGRVGRMLPKRKGGQVLERYQPRRSWARFCELQGLPPDFLADAPFTQEGRYRAVGNGVPLPTGRAIARAVREAMA